MIWFALVLGVVGVIALIVRSIADEEDIRIGATVVGTIGLVCLFLFGTISLFEKVEFGTVKVGTLFGAVKETTLEEGINFPVNPFMDWSVYNVQLSTVEYTGDNSLECLSQDDKEYWMEASISYMLLSQNVYWTKQNIKDLQSLITTAMRTGPRKASAEYNLMETNENLTKMEERALYYANQALLINVRNTYFTPETPDSEVILPFMITKVDFRKPELPKSIQLAITEKFAKQQEAEAMEFVLDKERKEATRKGIEAEGIATFQKTVSAGIDANLLYWRYIEVMRELAGSDNTTFIFAPDGRDNPFMMPLPLATDK